MSGVLLETVQRFTPLGVELWDLLTDSRITDGLAVSARPADRKGSFRPAFATASGVHAVTGIPGLRDVEHPRPAPGERVDVDDLPSAGLAVDVLVEDRLGRFLPTVVTLVAPRRGVATAADALAGCPSLVWSIPDDVPMFLLTGPDRSIPPSSATVRASLRDRATDQPAAHAVLVVEVAGRRHVAAADGSGNVLAAFAYPSPGTAVPPESLPAGSHGVPTDEQRWTVTVEARWRPAGLSFPHGVPVPRAHTLLCQPAATIVVDDALAAVPTLTADLVHGRELVLATAGVTEPERTSLLYLEPAP